MANMPKYYKIHTDGCTVELEPIYTELVPVVHGFNATDCPSLFECSICHWSDGDTLTGDTSTYNYCPNCGAKMDGERKGDDADR